MQTSDCPIYVITLDYSHARRATISARLHELNLSCEFRSGVDGRKLELLTHPDYDEDKRRLFFGRDLSAGEFGCILAHRDIYRYMSENRIPRALILEDDAILTDELPAVIESLCKIPETWDLVRFLGRAKNYQSTRAIVPLAGTSAMLSRPLRASGGAYGYVINLHAAEKLLAMMLKNWLAIDTLHGVIWLTGLRTLSVMPSPVLPNDEIPSCIDDLDDNARWDKWIQLTGWKRLAYPVTRGFWKLYMNVCTRYVSWRSLTTDAMIRKQYKAGS